MSRSVMTADDAEYAFYDYLGYDETDDYDYANELWEYYREYSPLGVRWRAQIAPKIDAELSRLRKIGVASNGEVFYEQVK